MRSFQARWERTRVGGPVITRKRTGWNMPYVMLGIAAGNLQSSSLQTSHAAVVQTALHWDATSLGQA